MITKIIPEHQIQQAKKLIEKYNNIVIVSHVFPDGDAVGSSLGLYHFLQALDKNVNIIVPNALPDNLRFLKGAGDILVYNRQKELSDEVIQNTELVFCLDFNAIKRLEDLAPAIEGKVVPRVMIDHHLEPEPFCNVTISHPEISSTSELIFRLICRMGMFDLLDIPCGEAIYTGMMTDTGNFTYNSNKAEMYFIVGELVKKGVNKDRIYSKVCNTNSIDKLRLNGYAISNKMEIYPKYKAALITLTSDELNKFNYQKGDSEGLVNVPLSIKNIVFSAFFREEREYIKISLRSKGSFPVNKIAADHFGGGGHLNAAGGEFMGTMEEARNRFIEILPQYASYLNV